MAYALVLTELRILEQVIFFFKELTLARIPHPHLGQTTTTSHCRVSRYKAPSFSITVDKEIISAVPHPGLQFYADEAQEHLQVEISPLLLVLGAEVEKHTISLEVTDIIMPTVGTATRDIMCRANLRDASPTKDELLLKLQLASTDATYSDLLELYIEAQEASNPRPAGAWAGHSFVVCAEPDGECHS
jgi:hypothetical protein